MLRSGQRHARHRLAQRPATSPSGSCWSPRRTYLPAYTPACSRPTTSNRALVTLPHAAVVSHIEVPSAADHWRSPTRPVSQESGRSPTRPVSQESWRSPTRPVSQEGGHRRHVREVGSHLESEEVGGAERAMWRRELAAVEQALVESEAHLQRLQVAQAAQAAHAEELRSASVSCNAMTTAPAHAAHEAAAHSVPATTSASHTGPARLSHAMAGQLAKQVIAQSRLEHDAMRAEVEADLQLMWRGLEADMANLAAAVRNVATCASAAG